MPNNLSTNHKKYGYLELYMEYSITPLPAFSELDDDQRAEIETFILAGKLNPEDTYMHDGWLIARQLGSAALIGCVGYERETDGETSNIYMQSLVVAKPHRRQGIGRHLANELFDIVIAPDEQLIALSPFWINGFFQKLGFERINAKEIKAQDSIAGREKFLRNTAWIKKRQIVE